MQTTKISLSIITGNHRKNIEEDSENLELIPSSSSGAAGLE